MAGPAYIKFPVYHLMGISNPYITHADIDVFKTNGNFIQNIQLLLKTLYQLYKSTKANHFIFQTEAARDNYCARTCISPSRTSVINNAFDMEMKSDISQFARRERKRERSFTIFCPGAAYSHKAFQFIPDLALELRVLLKKPFQFVLTLPDSDIMKLIDAKVKKFDLINHVKNIGPYDYNDIASLYSESDLVYVPSLLETFSATYLEAMVANKILVVANKKFAKDVCEEYAVYVDPLNALESAKTFQSIINNPTEYQNKSKISNSILNKFGNQKQRYEKIVDLILKKLT